MKPVKFAATLALALAVALAPAFAADAANSAKDASTTPVPQRNEIELEPAGVAPGTTVRQARIAQNWLLLTLGTAALAGIIFGLSGSESDSTTTTN